MSFIAPLFLLGVLAVAVPFWLHRLQTQSSDRKPFSSAMLLETTEQQVHVQKKLKYLVHYWHCAPHCLSSSHSPSRNLCG